MQIVAQASLLARSLEAWRPSDLETDASHSLPLLFSNPACCANRRGAEFDRGIEYLGVELSELRPF